MVDLCKRESQTKRGEDSCGEPPLEGGANSCNTIGEDWSLVQIVPPEGSPPPLAGSHILPVLAIDEDLPPLLVEGNKSTPTANQELEQWDDTPEGGGPVGHVDDEDDESIGDHPTPTLGRETTPWWKKGYKNQDY